MPELPPPPPPPLSLAAACADMVRRHRPAWATTRTAVVAAVVVGAAGSLLGAASLRQPSPPPPEVYLPRATSEPTGDVNASPGRVAVHAAGAFNKPGLYELPAGSRVADLVTAAGGAAADATVDALNLAAKLTDGERIYLPRAGEEPALATAADAASGVVDLNTATLDQLDALPGVGPSTAQAILDYRREHGRFRSVDELLEVRGIGDAKLASLRARVRV